MTDIQQSSMNYEITTPEGIAVKLPIAGLWSRSAAWLIDLSIRVLIYIICAIALSLLGLMGQGIMLIIIFTLEWFYPVLYEVLSDGKTPGKRKIKIKVIQTNGSHVDWAASMTRNILRFIDMLPIVYGIGFISVLSTRYFQRIGDIVANTIVVHETETVSFLIPDNSYIKNQMGSSVSLLNNELTRDEKAALYSYIERYDELSADRRQELAEILQPVLEKMDLPVNAESLKILSLSMLHDNESV